MFNTVSNDRIRILTRYQYSESAYEADPMSCEETSKICRLLRVHSRRKLQFDG